jgi:hypothetical protein
MLSLGLSPITDNQEALAELGFARSFPDAKRGGYEASVYERSIDQGYRNTKSGLKRVVIAQRAYLRAD